MKNEVRKFIQLLKSSFNNIISCVDIVLTYVKMTLLDYFVVGEMSSTGLF